MDGLRSREGLRNSPWKGRKKRPMVDESKQNVAKTTSAGRDVFAYPLPSKPPALQMKKHMPLADMVLPFVIKCWETIPEFAIYVSAINNKEARTGWFQADRYEAAKLVLAQANEDKSGAMFQGVKPNKIANAIEVVMRRLGLGRKQRMLGLQGQAAE
jgi:hypothetical protein